MSEIVGTNLLSEHYRLVVESVIARLPPDWHLVRGQPPKHVTFVETSESPEKPTGLSVTESRRDSPYRRTVSNHRVVLYTRKLSEYSIDAVRWAIAHELGHVVSSHLLGFGDEEKHEEWADSLAVGWGFSKEWEAWNQEVWNRTHPGGK